MKNRKSEYARINAEWLQKKSEEPGICQLPGGVLYKVIESGEDAGRHPSDSSVVTVRYEGHTIDGHVFDRSGEGVAPAFRLRDLIEGWIIALKKMVVGDEWEIYIPADKAYGKYGQPGIPANSTLIFRIALLSVM
ncbi:MAG: FKBP-type peptidyl-prolyl cis-trans isomerase [Muribaculaceae bacterium]|nr:FKBP-type peptidyl-prolyl cis-trans isomerase [Muribaculaceae bacterium]